MSGARAGAAFSDSVVTERTTRGNDYVEAATAAIEVGSRGSLKEAPDGAAAAITPRAIPR